MQKATCCPRPRAWKSAFHKVSGVYIQVRGAAVLDLGALAGVDEAVDHAEVVEGAAERAALTPSGAGGEGAVVGRPLAAAVAGAVTQWQAVRRGFGDGAGGERAAGGQGRPLDP